MTCEVAVLNKWGVALAADSAVCSADGAKVFHGAEKLFQLGGSAPVAIMTYGNAQYMGVPWEVIIAAYSRKLGDRRFETLREYLDDFISFIEGASTLFPPGLQETAFRSELSEIWSGLYREPLSTITRYQRMVRAGAMDKALQEIIREDHPHWEPHPRLEGIDDAFADQFMADHSEELDEIELEVFGPVRLSEKTQTGLRQTAHYFLTRSWNRSDESNIVITGFGEEEVFPGLFCYQVGPLIGGRMRGAATIAQRISRDCSALVYPFAQRHAIDLVVNGIHPRIQASLQEMAAAFEGGEPQRPVKRRKGQPSRAEQFEQQLNDEIESSFADPFMTAVSGLPREDLAALADTLINVAIFRARMMNKRETIKGPVDVAILSKGRGFEWVRRKRLSC